MKNVGIAALLLVTAGLCFGQAPRTSLNVPSTDVYVGYIATFPDFGPHLDSYRFDGVEVAVGKGLTPHIWVNGSGALSFGTVYSVKEFSGTIGPKFYVLTGKFRPYATAQAGFAVQHSNGMYAGDHHPPLKHVTDVEDGFTYRLGAGAELQVTSKLYWRILQWDIQPQPWARHTPWYENVSSGVGYRF